LLEFFIFRLHNLCIQTLAGQSTLASEHHEERFSGLPGEALRRIVIPDPFDFGRVPGRCQLSLGRHLGEGGEEKGYRQSRRRPSSFHKGVHGFILFREKK
jgi:hypothetical protein